MGGMKGKSGPRPGARDESEANRPSHLDAYRMMLYRFRCCAAQEERTSRAGKARVRAWRSGAVNRTSGLGPFRLRLPISLFTISQLHLFLHSFIQMPRWYHPDVIRCERAQDQDRDGFLDGGASVPGTGSSSVVCSFEVTTNEMLCVKLSSNITLGSWTPG